MYSSRPPRIVSRVSTRVSGAVVPCRGLAVSPQGLPELGGRMLCGGLGTWHGAAAADAAEGLWVWYASTGLVAAAGRGGGEPWSREEERELIGSGPVAVPVEGAGPGWRVRDVSCGVAHSAVLVDVVDARRP